MKILESVVYPWEVVVALVTNTLHIHHQGHTLVPEIKSNRISITLPEHCQFQSTQIQIHLI